MKLFFWLLVPCFAYATEVSMPMEARRALDAHWRLVRHEGGIIAAALLEHDGLVFNSTSAFFYSNSEPTEIFKVPVGKCMAVVAESLTPPSFYLEAGKKILLDSKDTHLELLRAPQSGTALAYYGPFEAVQEPLETGTFYTVRFDGFGWVPAQTWRRALAVPRKIVLSPNLDSISFKKEENFAFTWNPTGAEYMYLEFVTDRVNGLCHLSDRGGKQIVPSDFLKQMPVEGRITAVAWKERFHPLLHRTVRLMGATVHVGEYTIQ